MGVRVRVRVGVRVRVSLLTQQQQLHLSGRLLSIFSQVFVNHFRPLGRGFVFLTDRATHGSQCALQDCCLVSKISPGRKNDESTAESDEPSSGSAAAEVERDDFPFW